MPKSSKWALSFRFPHENPVCIYIVHLYRRIKPSPFIYPTLFCSTLFPAPLPPSLPNRLSFNLFLFITSPYRFSGNKVTTGGRRSWVPLSAWVPGTLAQSIDHRHTYPRCHFAGATNLCTMSPNICGPSVFNLPHVSLLAPGILRWLVDLLETCTPLL